MGLPEERDDDVTAIADLTGKILERAGRARRHVGQVTVSLNPFVPKPWTPFQWDPMEAPRSIKRKIALVRTALGRSAAGRGRRRVAARGVLSDHGFPRRSPGWRILERLSEKCERRRNLAGAQGDRARTAQAGASGMPDPNSL